jgi:hypothetical protein
MREWVYVFNSSYELFGLPRIDNSKPYKGSWNQPGFWPKRALGRKIVQEEFNFHVTERAKTYVKNFLNSCEVDNPIFSIVWALYANRNVYDWMFGAYSKTDLPDDFIVVIDDLKLVIEHQWRKSLSNKKLDIDNGYLKII